MPGPPPNGVSSTERCLSRAKSRMSTVSRAQRPEASACPAIDRPSGPGNIAGNSVKTRTVQSGSAIVRRSVGPRLDIDRRIDHRPAGGEIDERDGAIAERQQLGGTVGALH